MKIEEIVEQYFVWNEEAKRIERMLKELRPAIETHITTELNMPKLAEPATIKIGDFTATLSPTSRESFNLKEAKSNLDLEMLKPYLSVSNYTTLKINKLLK